MPALDGLADHRRRDLVGDLDVPHFAFALSGEVGEQLRDYKSPNLPPQAMAYALMHAAPMLNPQGKQQLAALRRQWQMLGSGRQTANIGRLRAANQEGDLLEWDGEDWVPVD